MTNFENNVLSILTFASTRATWVSTSSCAEKCDVPYGSVWQYLAMDDFGQVAYHFNYEYKIRRRGKTFYLSAVHRGFTSFSSKEYVWANSELRKRLGYN